MLGVCRGITLGADKTDRAGEEIQSLSRFVGAQRLAFQKLLKKYKKWTGSSKLGERFQKEVLNRPASFSNRDFGPLLTQWTEVLAAVRAPFDAGVHWHAESPSGKEIEPVSSGASSARSKSSSEGSVCEGKDEYANSAAELYGCCQQGSANDFDTVLALSSFDHRGGKASYWVHPDNLVELHVLLLQHTRLRNPITPVSPCRSSSSRSSSAGLMNENGAISGTNTSNDIGVFVCDDLQWFAKSRSSATISESGERAAATIRYSSAGEAVIVTEAAIQDVQPSSESRKNHLIHKTKLKRKILRRLFEPGAPSPVARSKSDSSVDSYTDATSDEGRISDTLRAWRAQHREVRPLVQIQMRRIRFVGLANTQSAGIWATLDRDIRMRTCPLNIFSGKEGLFIINEDTTSNAQKFPHAVLEFRFEGEQGRAVVAALDQSHLTERVHGFSLETHAVAALCQPKGMAPPFWLPVLDHDIRKLPAPVKPRDRRALNSSTALTDSTGRTSISTPSTADGPTSSGFSGPLMDSSGTSASEALGNAPMNECKKKRKFHPRRKHPLRVETNFDCPPQQVRYWNEFDDAEETSPNEAYTIFVDPHSESKFPGAALAATLMTGVQAWGKKATSWLGWAPSSSAPERQPLLRDQCSSSSSRECEVETDLEHNHVIPSSYQTCHPETRRYGSISATSTATTTRALRRGDRNLRRALIVSLLASITSLLIAIILVVIDGHNTASNNPALGIGVVICVTASLASGLLGLGTQLTASKPPRNRTSVAMMGLFFMMECLCGCALLVLVLNK